jgi:hypothetical protein
MFYVAANRCKPLHLTWLHHRCTTTIAAPVHPCQKGHAACHVSNHSTTWPGMSTVHLRGWYVGYITLCHDIMHCMQSTKVTFFSPQGTPTSCPARIAGTDPSHDLAVLAIDEPLFVVPPIRVGSSAGLKTGQFVYAIGNPSGLSRTQTCGVVSGLNRAIPSPTGTRIPGAIQTDATINAGAPLGMFDCNQTVSLQSHPGLCSCRLSLPGNVAEQGA